MISYRQIVDDQLWCHFVTFSCHRRRRLLDEDHPKRNVLGQLNSQLKRQAARCSGFVLMPDHVHALIQFPQPGQLSRFMHGWKRTSSYRIRDWYRAHDAKYFHVCDMEDKFWTPKYCSFEIYSDAKLREKLAYVHGNPVRAGLVGTATDWPWSSARYYEWRQSVGVTIVWPS